MQCDYKQIQLAGGKLVGGVEPGGGGGVKGGGGGKFFAAAGLSEPLPHYTGSLFCGQK